MLLLTLNALTWIPKLFYLFKAYLFIGLFCRNDHTLVTEVKKKNHTNGSVFLFMFSVPNKRHLCCHYLVCFLLFAQRCFINFFGTSYDH